MMDDGMSVVILYLGGAPVCSPDLACPRLATHPMRKAPNTARIVRLVGFVFITAPFEHRVLWIAERIAHLPGQSSGCLQTTRLARRGQVQRIGSGRAGREDVLA